MPLSVSDFNSNKNENILAAAEALNKSAQKRAVFDAVYHHKMKVKTVQWIADRAKLSRVQVLKVGRDLASKHLFTQTRKDNDTAYEQIPSIQAHKRQILRLAGDKKKQDSYETKRNPRGISRTIIQKVASSVGVRRITIDDLQAFKKAHAIKPLADRLPKELSEDGFRLGIQRILGEPGDFKDWGGENNDLYSGRLVVDRVRRSVAFAFKGPGLDARLRPKNMGKNGDQGPRLFDSPADVFFVQHWREIDESVVDLVQRLATARSLRDNQKTWYGIIDGKDSRRIYDAYSHCFSISPKPRKKK